MNKNSIFLNKEKSLKIFHWMEKRINNNKMIHKIKMKRIRLNRVSQRLLKSLQVMVFLII